MDGFDEMGWKTSARLAHAHRYTENEGQDGKNVRARWKGRVRLKYRKMRL